MKLEIHHDNFSDFTFLLNINEFCKDIHFPEKLFITYLQGFLGKIFLENNEYKFYGSFSQKEINVIVKKFYYTFVICDFCKEKTLLKLDSENYKFFLQCFNCDNNYEVYGSSAMYKCAFGPLKYYKEKTITDEFILI